MVNQKGFFSPNFACKEGKITRSRLVLRLPSNSLCYREVVAKKFSVTMASRFEIVDEKYAEELKDKSENENTKKSTEYWKHVFKKWANERNFPANLEESRVMSLTKHCRSFMHSEISNFALYVINK